ncbi:SET domain-containing protein-lysine N-methyltransferase [Burkholderia vietnamiensis]|nr:SET domain-containing protein-lysine N-methyltransferase [Burkholderia vietnamiensis]
MSDGRVIDGAQGGNSARWINHACDANCQAVEIEDRVFIEVLRNIGPGEEIFIDYGLQVEESVTDDMRREYACHCGSGACRGTMLSDAHRAT